MSLSADKLNKFTKNNITRKIMSDKNLRPWSIKTVDKMLNNKKVNFFEEFENIMLANQQLKLPDLNN